MNIILLSLVLVFCGQQQKSWYLSLGDGSASLGIFYTENAVKVGLEGELFQGRAKVAAAVKDEFANFSGYENRSVYHEVAAVESGNYVYEIGAFFGQAGEEYVQCLVYKKVDGEMLRSVEVIRERGTFEAANDELDAARERWMAYCNANKAFDLVREVYTDDALYYDHKEVFQGTLSIAAKYSYMNNPGYNLKLQPLHVEQVSNQFAFEIGQCKGTYGGKYILIWRKDEDGQWRVYFDTNL